MLLKKSSSFFEKISKLISSLREIFKSLGRVLKGKDIHITPSNLSQSHDPAITNLGGSGTIKVSPKVEENFANAKPTSRMRENGESFFDRIRQWLKTAKDICNADANSPFFQILADKIRMAEVVLVIALACLLLLVLGPLLIRRLTRYQVPVFISYQHQQSHIADDVSRILKEAHLKSLKVSYKEDASHQDVVLEVNKQLRSCDFLICLPGRTGSFVEAEVMAATLANKPILVLLENGGTVPNTFDKMYPVLDQQVLNDEYRQLFGRMVSFLSCDYQSTFLTLQAAWASTVRLGQKYLFVIISFSIVFFIVQLADTFELCAPAVRSHPAPLFAAFFTVLILWLSISFLSLTVIVSCKMTGLIRQARGIRRKFDLGQFSPQKWRSYLNDIGCQELYPLLVGGVMAHHEAEAKPTGMSPTNSWGKTIKKTLRNAGRKKSSPQDF